MKINLVVEGVLRDIPETRNSDKLLQIEVWERMGLYLSESQRAKFLSMPSTETVRRVRQLIQAKGKYRASEPIRKARQWKGLVFQQNEPKASVEYAERLLDQYQGRMF